jgi:hypothetical protein
MARRSSRWRPIRRPSMLDQLVPPYLRNPRKKGRSRDRDKDDGGVPVEPNRPNTLSGGAAAELEFDD